MEGFVHFRARPRSDLTLGKVQQILTRFISR